MINWKRNVFQFFVTQSTAAWIQLAVKSQWKKNKTIMFISRRIRNIENLYKYLKICCVLFDVNFC